LKLTSMMTGKFMLLFGVICFSAVVRGGGQDTWQKSHSERYGSCIQNAGGVHLEMIACIDEEIDKNNTEIHSQLAVAKEDPSITELWMSLKKSQSAWESYIKLKCEPYQKIGGQRATLLTRSCLSDETLSRNSFIKTLLIEAQI